MVGSSELLGKQVRHPIFGEGVVEGVRWRDSFLYVRFGERIAIWLPSQQVRFKKAKVKAVPRKIRLPGPSRLGGDQVKPRRMVEAFRYGIVPHRDIEDFTFGRDKELKEVKRCFEELEIRRGSALIIEGEYGSGKTHFLNYIEELATERGYLVARAALDRWEVTPARPWRVYRELAKSIRFKDGGLREFLTQAARLDPLNPPHIFLTPALQRIARGKADPMLWQWIAGERNPRFYLDEYGSYWKLPVLLTHSTAADIYAYILSGIGWLAKGIGLKGFVILLDEVETAFWLLLDRDKAFGFLKGLIHVALNNPLLTTKGSGRSLRLFHSGVRTTPYIYKIPSNIFLIIALTPVWSLVYREIKELVGKEAVMLSELTLENYGEMFEALISLYQAAYPEMEFSFDLDHVFQILINQREKGIRFFLKASVEALDLMRHHPEKSLPSVLKYEYA